MSDEILKFKDTINYFNLIKVSTNDSMGPSQHKLFTCEGH